MSDEGEQEEEELAQADWPVKGPATPQQALVAIAFVFVLGLVLGFLLAKTF